MSILDDLFGEQSTAIQFFTWAILAEVVRSLINPFLQQLVQDVSSEHPVTPLSPAILADLVVRSYLTQDQAATIARLSGVSVQDFALLVDDTGEPPATDFLLEAYRRGLIGLDQPMGDNPSLVQGIHESRVKDEWVTLIDQMRTNVLSAAEWVQAYLRGQVDLATAQTGAYQAGITAEDFTVLFNTAGNPPSPGELVTLVRRGLIPFKGLGPDALTFQQGIFEGDAKDKWEPLYEALSVYVPPPRTVTTLLSHGVITEAQAQQLFQDAGITPELAAAYSASATAEKLVTDKQLAKATVLQLYEQRMIDEPTALQDLALLGYDGAEGTFLIALQDAQRSIKAVNAAVSRVQTLFVGRKISPGAAQSLLGELEIPAPAIQSLIQTWTLEQRTFTRILTEAQVADGFKYGSLTEAQASTKLQDLGYSAFDAWVLLGNANLGALPNPPPFDDEPAGNVA